MQDVLVLLKNSITTLQSNITQVESNIEEVQQDMIFLAPGTYTGNGQNSITITFGQLNRQPKMIFINGKSLSGDKECYTGIGMNGCVVGLYTYCRTTGYYGSEYGGIYTISFTTSSVKITKAYSNDLKDELNNNGQTYNYILLG